MRRLPVYLLLDTSGSMSGSAIEAVRNGIRCLLSALQNDPYAIETAFLSIISFNNHAEVLVPLTEITAVNNPTIQAGGQTAMGEALELLCDRVDKEVQKSSANAKGDWKPIVFLMTDGEPTDDLTRGIAQMKQHNFGTVVACAAGSYARTDKLKLITENVVRLDNVDNVTIKAYFKWVSASISVSSKAVDSPVGGNNSLNDLPAPPPEVSVVL